MADKLHYDLDTLRGQAKAITKISDDLRSHKDNLQDWLGKLKGEWDSGASEKFFDIYDTSWVPHVDKYCEMLDELSQALKDAADKYEPLTQEYNRISLDV